MGGLPSRITYLYTAKGRIAFAHFQTRHQISFIDGGVFEQNGRGVKQAPRLVGSFSDQTPIHGNYNGDMVSVHFVNAMSKPVVAPYRGSEARYVTNPFTVGIPVPGREPMLLDFAPSALAMG